MPIPSQGLLPPDGTQGRTGQEEEGSKGIPTTQVASPLEAGRVPTSLGTHPLI